MGQPLFSNNAYTTLSVGCASGDATLTVTSSTTFPAVLTASGNWFYACLQDTFANMEIVKVTNVTGLVWTVTRAIGGTTARAFVSGSVVELRMTADYLTDVYAYSITGSLQNSTPQWLTSVTGTDTITAGLTPVLTGYAAGQTFRMLTIGTNTTGSVTLNINGLGAKAVTKTGAVALAAGDLVIGVVYEFTYDGTRFQALAVGSIAANLLGGVAGAVPYQSGVNTTGFSAAGTAGQALLSGGTGAPTWGNITAAQLQPITAAVASNAITITPSALSLDFRSSTLTDGTVTRVSGTPAALVIAATDSFGLVTAAGKQRVAILATNNAGTIELAASALAGGVSLDETGVITTATAATLGTHIKAANVRTGVAYRVIGFVDATFTTATGWGSLAEVQGAGGNAITAMSSLGYGQTWQDVTGSRALGTTYYNTTGKPIQFVATLAQAGSNTSYLTITVNGLVVGYASAFGGGNFGSCFVVAPPGASYSAAISGAGASYSSWFELR